MRIPPSLLLLLGTPLASMGCASPCPDQQHLGDDGLCHNDEEEFSDDDSDPTDDPPDDSGGATDREHGYGANTEDAEDWGIGASGFSAEDYGIGELLPAIDWREVDGNFVTSIKDQGSVGSCVLFAAMGAMESAYLIQRSESDDIDLSEQYPIDCSDTIDENGNSLQDVADYLVETGTVTEDDAPYLEGSGDCADYPRSVDYQALETFYLVGDDELKQALHLGPVMVWFRVYDDFQDWWRTDSDGVYEHGADASYEGSGHAVTLVGYDEEEQAWIMKNSWGDDGGDDGFFKMAYSESGFGGTGYLFRVTDSDFTRGLTLLDYGSCSSNAYQQCYGGDVYWYDSCDVREGIADNCTSSEACVDTSSTTASCEEDCNPNDYQQCSDGDVYWYDSCGNRETVADNCTASETCVDSSSSTARCEEGCTSNDYQQCSGGDVYWYDSCGNRGSVVDACSSSETCVDTSSTTASCEESCTSSSYQQCYGGDVYWYDSCDVREGIVDNCSSSETCVDTSSTTAACESTCTSSDYQQCYGGDVYWYDSCDVREGIVDNCSSSETCVDTSSTTASCEATCSETDYWSPDNMSDTATVSSTTLEVEFRDAGSSGEIEVRVCKSSGTFSNDIHLTFEEWVKYSGYGMLDDDLATSGATCSGWETLATSGWSEGDGFGGDAQVVSPDSCESTWGWGCYDDGSTCGTCWFFSTSVMYRTCL